MLDRIGADVNIYASDPTQAQALSGNHENTEVGKFLHDYLDLDLKEITQELREKAASFTMRDDSGAEIGWMGRAADDRGEGLDHYHGDFRKRSECGCGL